MREQLPEILRGFREEGAEADLLVGGANRQPEVVLLSYESYLGLMDDLDNLSIQALYAERVEGRETITGRTLEDAAAELGFEPDELLSAPEAAAARARYQLGALVNPIQSPPTGCCRALPPDAGRGRTQRLSALGAAIEIRARQTS